MDKDYVAGVIGIAKLLLFALVGLPTLAAVLAITAYLLK